MTLPTDRPSYDSKRIFKTALDLDIDDPDAVKSIAEYLRRNYKNREIFKNLLNELTQFFFYEKTAPTTAFLHLYRSLEWISYCAPMIYASLTRDFKNSYNSLKSFFTDDKAGQISFFTTFLNTIIQGDSALQSFSFEYSPVGSERSEIESDFKRLACEANLRVEFVHGVCRIQFVNVAKIFKIVRDRYFHFAIGSEKQNIVAFNYNIEDLMLPLNRILINWISVVLSLIVIRGYTSM